MKSEPDEPPPDFDDAQVLDWRLSNYIVRYVATALGYTDVPFLNPPPFLPLMVESSGLIQLPLPSTPYVTRFYGHRLVIQMGASDRSLSVTTTEGMIRADFGISGYDEEIKKYRTTIMSEIDDNEEKVLELADPSSIDLLVTMFKQFLKKYDDTYEPDYSDGKRRRRYRR